MNALEAVITVLDAGKEGKASAAAAKETLAAGEMPPDEGTTANTLEVKTEDDVKAATIALRKSLGLEVKE